MATARATDAPLADAGGRSAAGVAAPGSTSFADGDGGQAEADDPVEPVGTKPGVGGEPDEHGGGLRGAEQVLVAFPGGGGAVERGAQAALSPKLRAL